MRADISAKAFTNGILPSIRDLGKRFDVSTMTISSALDVLASEGLIERVKGKGVYVKDAQSNRPWLVNSTKQLALFCNRTAAALTDDTYYAEVWEGLLEEAAAGSHTLTFLLLEKGQELERIRQALATMRFDGAVLLAVTDKDVLRRIKKLDLPVVLADHHFDDFPIDNVDLDSYQGSKAVVEHLLALGHREVGIFLSPKPENNPERWAGYKDALIAAGLDPEKQLSRSGIPNQLGGRAVAEALLKEGAHLPTSLYVWNGMMAAGAIQAFTRKGIRVPEDISVATVGPRDFVRKFPRITTAVADADRIGRDAIQTLLERIKNPTAKIQTVRVPMELMVLGSTASPS